ncbi:caspase recruitment domain-containing protein 8-like [Gasterosteus aculeatus]
MASPEERRGPERDGSCFSRAARALRRALICRCSYAKPAPTLTPSSTPSLSTAPSEADPEADSEESNSFITGASANPPGRSYTQKDYTHYSPTKQFSRQTNRKSSGTEKRTKTDSAPPSSVISYKPSPPTITTYFQGAGQKRAEPVSHLPNGSEHDVDPDCSQSLILMVEGPPPARCRSALARDSPAADAFESSPTQHEREPGGDADVLTETDASFPAASHSVTGASPAAGQQDFTPDITADEGDETFRLWCSGPGLYLCSVTGLVFHIGGNGGEVVYRIVPWDRRLLDRHHKKPAGPLFNIECEQRSVLGLHLPHCEIQSGGGGDFLSVAHVEDEGVEFLRPREVTETHVVVDVSGLSAFGNVKDVDSPPQPVRALVLLFYRPPNYPDNPKPESHLNVLMLPSNVVVREVKCSRKNDVGPESYIETPTQCKLHPDREYVLSTSPQDDRVIVQPTKAEFHCNYNNYFPSFQVTLETRLKEIKLFLNEGDGSLSVWERRVGLSDAVVASRRPSERPSERLLKVRSDFVKSISEPVLKSLLDRLLEKKVITDDEREAAEAKPNYSDRARFVIDAVRKKGDDASLEMIEFLKEVAPFLREHLRLM